MALNSSSVDYFHLNSVAYDTDGKFLFSVHHVSVVGKIDRCRQRPQSSVFPRRRVVGARDNLIANVAVR